MSGNLTTSASDIVQGSLLNINAYSPGQALSNTVASTVMQIFNDLVDSLSTDQAFIYTQTQNIFSWTPGQYQYTVGNPTGGTFTGYPTVSSNVLTGVTVPSNLIVGGDISDIGGAIPNGTTITAFSSSGNTITLSENATASLPTGDVFTYTVPGDWAIPRPIRIRNSFTRVTTSAAAGLDYFIDIISFDRYNEIGLKTVPGPWPYIMAYQPTFPLANLWVYPNPSIAGSVYLYTDYIIPELTNLTQLINLPQGYNRAFKKLLALELCPVFGKQPSPQLITQAKEAKDLIKNLNSSPVTTLRYDSDLIYSRHTDASWIVSGGFV